MNCPTCGIRDDTPHPPRVCADYAGAELAKKTVALDGALEKIAKLARERRGFQLMAGEMFNGNDPGHWMSMMEEGKYERSGGDVECKACGVLYYDHPELPKLPTFHMLCDGRIVKT